MIQNGYLMLSLYNSLHPQGTGHSKGGDHDWTDDATPTPRPDEEFGGQKPDTMSKYDL